jgi:hypothetical protein
VPHGTVGLLENLSSDTTDSEQSREDQEKRTEENEEKPADSKIENTSTKTDAIGKANQQPKSNDTKPRAKSSPSQEEKQQEVQGCEIDSYHVRIPNYDIESYEQSMGDDTTGCTGCDNIIGKATRMYSCRKCTNKHVLCLTCKTEPEDETLLAEQCRHGNYDEMESYEACVGGTYSWMNRDKPKKKCSSCGEEKKPTNGNPIYNGWMRQTRNWKTRVVLAEGEQRCAMHEESLYLV